MHLKVMEPLFTKVPEVPVFETELTSGEEPEVPGILTAKILPSIATF